MRTEIIFTINFYVSNLIFNTVNNISSIIKNKLLCIKLDIKYGKSENQI